MGRLKRKPVNTDEEKDVLIGLITQDELCEIIVPALIDFNEKHRNKKDYDEKFAPALFKLFEIEYSGVVIEWIIEHYKEYKCSLKTDIKRLYFDHKEKDPRFQRRKGDDPEKKPAMQELMDEFLECSLSDRLERQKEDKDYHFNLHFEADRAIEFLNNQLIKQSVDGMVKHKELGNLRMIEHIKGDDYKFGSSTLNFNPVLKAFESIPKNIIDGSESGTTLHVMAEVEDTQAIKIFLKDGEDVIRFTRPFEVPEEHQDYLKNKDVIIWLTKRSPQINEQARVIADSLKLYVRTVKMVTPLVKNPGISFDDWVKQEFPDGDISGIKKQVFKESMRGLVDSSTNIIYEHFPRAIRELVIEDQDEEDFEDDPILLAPFIKRGSLGFIVGEEESGKSWVAIEIAAAIHKGRDAFNGDWPLIRAANAIYFDGEMQESDLVTRWKGCKARGLPIVSAQKMQRYGAPDRMSLNDLQMQKWILDFLEERDVSFVVFDNLFSLSESDPQLTWEQGFNIIKNFLLELRGRGIAAIIVDHTARGGKDPYGSITKKRVLNYIMTLQKVKPILTAEEREELGENADKVVAFSIEDRKGRAFYYEGVSTKGKVYQNVLGEWKVFDQRGEGKRDLYIMISKMTVNKKMIQTAIVNELREEGHNINQGAVSKILTELRSEGGPFGDGPWLSGKNFTTLGFKECESRLDDEED